MNIEQLAAQVGFLPADWQLLGKHLERFAALVRAAALEEAAACNVFPVVASIPHGAEYNHGRRLYQLGADHLRLAIRALKDKP